MDSLVVAMAAVYEYGVGKSDRGGIIDIDIIIIIIIITAASSA